MDKYRHISKRQTASKMINNLTSVKDINFTKDDSTAIGLRFQSNNVW